MHSRSRNPRSLTGCQSASVILVALPLILSATAHSTASRGGQTEPVSLLKCLDELVATITYTQKLCVRLDSIVAILRDRRRHGDHLAIARRELRVVLALQRLEHLTDLLVGV